MTVEAVHLAGQRFEVENSENREMKRYSTRPLCRQFLCVVLLVNLGTLGQQETLGVLDIGLS